MKETWINDMQQKLADYEMPAPELAWDEIEQAVGSAAEGSREKALTIPIWRKALTMPMWRTRIAAEVLCLLVAGSALYFLNRKANDTIATIASTESTIPTVSKEPVAIINKERARLNTVRTVPSVFPSPTEPTEPTDPTAPTAQPDAPQANTSPADTLAPLMASSHVHSVKPADTEPDIPKQPATPNRLTAKVYLSNTLASADGLGLENRDLDTWPNYASDPLHGEEATNGQLPFSDPTLPSAVASELTETRHHQPVRFGLMLRYPLDSRWALESGLTYTRLSADITRYSGGRISTAEQSLNYIGIPVALSYRLWQRRPLAVYASFGGMVEKMIDGSLKEHGETTSLTIRPLQFSLNGAIGAELRLTPWLNLFVEPSVGYYFDNGSSVETHYQDKPLNLHLNLGLRFDLP